MTQRFLLLLATAQQPEEIVALTFTRKAAAEMRGRVIEKLLSAQRESCPEQAHARKTWQLAAKALARDEEQQWGLLKNPNRLNIQTIDGLCYSLTRRMPILAQFGANPEILTDAQPYYRAAAEAVFAALDKQQAWSSAVALLLGHLDNHVQRFLSLLQALLARREQWLPHLLHRDPEAFRQELESTLQDVVSESLDRLAQAVPQKHATEICSLARFAAEQLSAVGSESPIVSWVEQLDLPPANGEGLPLWLGVSKLLLTESGTWRKSVTKTVGFPAPSSVDKSLKPYFESHKKAMLALLSELQEQDNFRQCLLACRQLPATCYPEQQWQVLQSLTTLLPVAAAELMVLFRNKGKVDFSEIAQRALLALGPPEQPTDLAFALDHRIQHILVDEFQDTSVQQFTLLERLTAGWQPGDGRSLFVVGDPMQSIYRFREAEVGLFLRAQQQGIGDLPLTPVQLQANFRSTQAVVTWVNDHFAQVFPSRDDMSAGAVSYHPSVAVNQEDDNKAVQLHLFQHSDESASSESEALIKLIHQTRQQRPESSIAILVRARSHLMAILPALQQAGLPYQAVEIDSLAQQPVVQDLFALTKALLHLADRTAWLSVLRGPWCGLTLHDLHAIAGDDPEVILWQKLQDYKNMPGLSIDGRQRLQRVVPVVAASLAQRQRLPLRDWVESTWLMLGGPACVTQVRDLEDANAYLQLLEAPSSSPEGSLLQEIEQRLQSLYGTPDSSADGSLQVMTIHKSKGLEFDTVILPGLHRGAAPESKRLLMWMERPMSRGGIGLLMSPIHSSDDVSDSIYSYLREQETVKQRHEAARLLYVAVTRAKSACHLMAELGVDEETGEVRKPGGSSLFALLWLSVADDLPPLRMERERAEQSEVALPQLRRLTNTWQLPVNEVGDRIAQRLNVQGQLSHSSNPMNPGFTLPEDPRWRHLGTVIHGVFEQISKEGLESWQSRKLNSRKPFWRQRLASLGVLPSQLDESVELVEQAVQFTLRDEQGCWLLDNSHKDCHSEWALSACIDGIIHNVVIDRSFIDEQGRRWIIDYKTAQCEGDREAFVALQWQKYQEQLCKYAQIMSLREERGTIIALYFPLAGGLESKDLSFCYNSP